MLEARHQSAGDALGNSKGGGSRNPVGDGRGEMSSNKIEIVENAMIMIACAGVESHEERIHK